MTPKEQAKKLKVLIAERLSDVAGFELYALQIAQIAADEIIQVVKEWEARTGHIDETKYWEKVKEYLVV